MTINLDKSTWTYTVDGVTVKSVTTILKEAGLINLKWYTEAGKLRGTNMHTLLATYDLTGYIPDDEQPGMLKAWTKFLGDTNFTNDYVEHKVAGIMKDKIMYAGTLDRMGMLSGKQTVIDIKTGGNEDWHELQVMAYMEAVHCDNGGIIYLRDNGTYSYVPITDNKALLRSQWWTLVSTLNTFL